MTVFEISMLALAGAFLLVFCFFVYKLSSVLVARAPEKTPTLQHLDNVSQSLNALAALMHSVPDTMTSIRATAEALRTSLETRDRLLLGSPQEISAAMLLAKSATHLSAVASAQIQGSSAWLKQMGTLTTTISAVKESIDKVHKRALSDQLTTYPRKIQFIESDRFNFEFPGRDRAYLTLTARGQRNRFRLVCEARQCTHKKEGATEPERYISSTTYELPKDEHVTFVTHCLLRPDSKLRVEGFFDFLEGTGVVEKGADAFKEFVKEHGYAAATAVLGCKTTVYLGSAAGALYLTSVIVVKKAFELYIERLQKDRADTEATTRVRELLFMNPYQVKDVGGPSHVHFGEWLRRHGESNGKPSLNPYGGLTRWLDPTAQEFAWLCPEDAYAQIEKYDHLKILPSSTGAMSATASTH
jgi:hypothetical protein